MRDCANHTLYSGQRKPRTAEGVSWRALYDDYIKSDEWRAVRKRYRKSKLPWKCAVCDVAVNLHLHHRTYKRLGREQLTDLVPLCKFHHEETHRVARDGVQLWDAHRRVGFQPTILPPSPRKGRRKNKLSKQKPAALIRLKKRTKKNSTPEMVLWCAECHIVFPHGYMKLRCQCGNVITYRK